MSGLNSLGKVLNMTNLQEKLGLNDTQWAISNVFHANSIERVGRSITSNTRFVHYTNAETAAKLFRNHQVWLRKSTNMNDFMEIEHGLNCLSNAYKRNKPNFEKGFEALFPGICLKLEKHFDGWLPTYRSGTFIACVSEHDDDPERNEDRMGRLSMWRAYGGTSGVAIVIKPDVFHRPISSDALKAYTSPVAYLDVEGFDIEFKRLISRI